MIPVETDWNVHCSNLLTLGRGYRRRESSRSIAARLLFPIGTALGQGLHPAERSL